jgi:hypothetical protein
LSVLGHQALAALALALSVLAPCITGHWFAEGRWSVMKISFTEWVEAHGRRSGADWNLLAFGCLSETRAKI